MTFIFVCKAAVHKITESEAKLIYYMHSINAYEYGVDETSLYAQFQQWYLEEYSASLDTKTMYDAVEQLLKWNILDMNEGKIYLQEKAVVYR